MIYQRIIHGLDGEARLRVDAILGDETAVVEVGRLRREAVESFDIEIG